MSLRLTPVSTPRALRLFRDLPQRLHGQNPAFIPMLDVAFSAVMDRRKNPFWSKTTEGREWICWRGNEPVGRIGACRDDALFARKAGCGTVGFFDSADDEEVAKSLFDQAEGWLVERGCNSARGPLNYSIHDTAGVLVDGFDTPPTVDTTWNPKYYDALWTGAGWAGAQDMLGASGMLEHLGPEKARRFAEIAKKRGGYSVRSLDLKRFDEELESFRKVYNAAWDDNWGHVAISNEEFLFKAKDMKAVLDPDLVRIAEKDGEPVGCFLGLPDLNVAVKRSGGKIFPFGWFRLLRAKKRGGRVRVLMLGVVPEHRFAGVEALLLADSFQAIGERYPWCEASWVLEDNHAMVNGLARYNLHPYKRWRMYQKQLSAVRPLSQRG